MWNRLDGLVRMPRWRRLVAVALPVGLVLTGLGAGAGVAYAQVAPESVTKTVSGATATCTVQHDLTAIDCDLADTKADKNSVFLQWAIDDDETRWANKNGSNPSNNKKSFSESGLNKDNSAETIYWRVCVDKNLRGDTCSDSAVTLGINRPIDFFCSSPSTPPSPSIPPDLQPTCDPVDPDPRFSEIDKCAIGVGLAIVGLADESNSSANKAKEIMEQGGRVTLKKLGPVGWGLTIAGVTTAVSECNL